MQFPSYRRLLVAGTTVAAVVTLFAMPASASAQLVDADSDSSDLQTQVDVLQTQVAWLQQQANQEQGERTGVYQLGGPGLTVIGNGVTTLGRPGLTVIN